MIPPKHAAAAPLVGLDRKRIVILVGEAGVYTADPRADPRAERIAQINGANIAAVLRGTGGSHGVDVTGGMRAKVELSWRLVEAPGIGHDHKAMFDDPMCATALFGRPVDAPFGSGKGSPALRFPPRERAEPTIWPATIEEEQARTPSPKPLVAKSASPGGTGSNPAYDRLARDHPEVAKAFLKFIASPEAAPLLRKSAMEPWH